MSRVVHVVPTYWPATRYGGPIASVDALARAQAGTGAAVDVLTTSVDGRVDLDVPVDRAVDRGGVSVWYARAGFPRRLYVAPGLARHAARIVPRASVVHLHSVFLWPTWRAARIAAASGVPYVVSPRGMLVRDLIRARGSLRKRAWISLVEARTLRAAAMIHATSELERDELQALGIGRLPPIGIVPNGVDVPADPGLPRGPRVAYVGRLSWKKRIDWALRAVASIPGTELDVVGPDEDGMLPVLQALARALGIAGRVRFHGELAPPERDKLLWQAGALVLPSLSENFGNAVVEAMACGCPVITTPGVGASAIVRAADAGFVVDGPADLAAALGGLLADPAAAAAAGTRGRRHVASHLGWPTVAARMLDLYREAAHRASATRNA